MTFRTCLKSTVGLFALVAAGPVWAADMLPPPPAPSVEVADYSSTSSSCMYARADVGGAFHERPSVTKAAIGPGPGFGLSAIGEQIEDTALFEIGVGCQLLETFRIEAVVGTRLKQSLTDSFNSLDANIQTSTAFVNATYDITNYGGWTPYIGGGIGVAYHRITDVVMPVDSSSGDEFDFAWNLHAGITYDISPQTKIDFGYRFADLGRARSGGPIPMFVDDLITHEFKVGVRYQFGVN